MKLTNRTVLITGGTSGIGLALAKQLHARRNTVLVTGRDPGRLREVERMLPGVRGLRCDVGQAASVAALYEQVVAHHPALDVLVNNAGIMRNLNLHQERELDDVTREIETNLSGPVRMIQRFLPHLESRPAALIVNVTSGLAFVPLPAAPIYSATKAALHSYTKSLRVQLAGSSVTVVDLAPPSVQTPLIDREWSAEMAGQKLMSADDLAQRALGGIEAGKLEIRPGISNVLKVMSRIAPQFMFRQLAKMSQKSAPLLLESAAPPRP